MVSFVDPTTDQPLILLDYESTDAPVYKMQHKFRYLSTFARYTPTIRVLGLLITITDILPGYDRSEDAALRERFATVWIRELISDLHRISHNQRIPFLLGTFRPDHLQLALFHGGQITHEEVVSYGNRQVI